MSTSSVCGRVHPCLPFGNEIPLELTSTHTQIIYISLYIYIYMYTHTHNLSSFPQSIVFLHLRLFVREVSVHRPASRTQPWRPRSNSRLSCNALYSPPEGTNVSLDPLGYHVVSLCAHLPATPPSLHDLQGIHLLSSMLLAEEKKCAISAEECSLFVPIFTLRSSCPFHLFHCKL